MATQTGVEVQLVGTDGNVFALIGRTMRALRQAGLNDEAEEFYNATNRCESYDEVLQLIMRTVEVS